MGGYGDRFDFLFLPTGGRGAVSKSNLGYAFINLINPEDVAGFTQAFISYRFKGTRSAKVGAVKAAHVQGLANNLQHFSGMSLKKRPYGLLFRSHIPSNEGGPVP